jgi:hypothetical protein
MQEKRCTYNASLPKWDIRNQKYPSKPIILPRGSNYFKNTAKAHQIDGYVLRMAKKEVGQRTISFLLAVGKNQPGQLFHEASFAGPSLQCARGNSHACGRPASSTQLAQNNAISNLTFVAKSAARVC